MTSNFFKTALITITVVSLIFTACKKEETNDPNIIDKVVNISLGNNFPSNITEDANHNYIDLNGDGTNDINLETFVEAIGSDTIINGVGIFLDNGYVLTQGSAFYGFVPVLKTVASGSTINNSLTTYNFGGFAYSRVYKGSTTINTIESGTGEQYLPFKVNLGSSTHFGWIKFEVSSDKKSFNVKEVAYHKTANTEIKAGAK